MTLKKQSLKNHFFVFLQNPNVIHLPFDRTEIFRSFRWRTIVLYDIVWLRVLNMSYFQAKMSTILTVDSIWIIQNMTKAYSFLWCLYDWLLIFRIMIN